MTPPDFGMCEPDKVPTHHHTHSHSITVTSLVCHMWVLAGVGLLIGVRTKTLVAAAGCARALIFYRRRHHQQAKPVIQLNLKAIPIDLPVTRHQLAATYRVASVAGRSAWHSARLFSGICNVGVVLARRNCYYK